MTSQKTYITSIKDIPEKFYNHFLPKNSNFKVDDFEEVIMQDLMRSDDNIKEKLNRDMTKKFTEWLHKKLEKKENISVSIMGSTRSGKSLAGLRIQDVIYDFYNKGFDTDKITCANQKEFRQKLQNADFGDGYLIDEESKANAGEGSMTEELQLKDVQNIIAKENIHTVYITPRQFTDSNSELGLKYWGKDTDNWTTRFLLYSLKGGNPVLLGYVVIDVGALFRRHGCFIYQLTGGCTNPDKKVLKDLKKEYIKYSFALPQYREEDLTERGTCPFYDICKHPLNAYEHKKDKWIKREMKGGMDERTMERNITAIKLLKLLSSGYNEDKGVIGLTAESGKDLKIRLKNKIPRITNTKFTVTETEEIFETVKSMSKNPSVFKDIALSCEIDFDSEFRSLGGNPKNLEESEEKDNVDLAKLEPEENQNT